MFKKFFLIAVLGFFTLSCSKSEDDGKGMDFVANLPYTPLNELSEVGDETYYYVGIRVGDYKMNLISETNAGCVKFDKIVAEKNDKGEIINLRYKRSNIGCVGGYVDILMSRNRMISPGIMDTNIYVAGSYEKGENGEEILVPSKSNERYEGQVEIGFQGEYLRIEDRMSHFTYPSKVDKVYLYFEKRPQ